MALQPNSFTDILDPRFQEMRTDRFDNLPEIKDKLYRTVGGKQKTERFGNVGAMGDIPQFTGSVDYDDVYQGYDTLVTPLEFASGIQIERTLIDDDQFDIIMGRPRALFGAMFRTRQAHALRPFNNAFAVDSFFYNNTEGVAMCSNSHTTTSGASTATGFDNLVTAALSATQIATNRIQMVGFRGDRAERIAVTPSAILVPPSLYDRAYEVVGGPGKPDTANNNPNVHYGQYEIIETNYLTNTNNYYMLDMELCMDFMVWIDRVKGEFAFVEDFDTFVGKWRSYMRYGNAWLDWRHILGAQVS